MKSINYVSAISLFRLQVCAQGPGLLKYYYCTSHITFTSPFTLELFFFLSTYCLRLGLPFPGWKREIRYTPHFDLCLIFENLSSSWSNKRLLYKQCFAIANYIYFQSKYIFRRCLFRLGPTFFLHSHNLW